MFHGPGERVYAVSDVYIERSPEKGELVAWGWRLLLNRCPAVVFYSVEGLIVVVFLKDQIS